MNLVEADAKSLLAGYGVSVPHGILLQEADPVPAHRMKGVAVKAQVLKGGRGKAGLIELVDSADDAPLDETRLDAAIDSVRRKLRAQDMPALLLLEEKLDIRAEYYLSFLIDDRAQAPLMLFSSQGGMDVEGAPPPWRLRIDPMLGLSPHSVIEFFSSARVPADVLGVLSRLAALLYRICVAEDLELLEINPLAITAQGRLVAVDAKIILDDCAAFRHRNRDFAASRCLSLASMTALEREADSKRFTYIELPGDVALMTYGAGLGMMMVDLLGDAGLRAACFIDGSVASVGNNTEERLRIVFKRAEAPEVKAILFYQNLGTRDIKPRVDAVLKVLRETPPPKPFYFGFVATYLAERNMTAIEACQMVSALGYKTSQEPLELVEMIRRDCLTSVPGLEHRAPIATQQPKEQVI